MIEKYFNGVIEQVYHRIGTAEKNIVTAPMRGGWVSSPKRA